MLNESDAELSWRISGGGRFVFSHCSDTVRQRRGGERSGERGESEPDWNGTPAQWRPLQAGQVSEEGSVARPDPFRSGAMEIELVE